MCWSRNISITTVTVEAICIAYIVHRSFSATNPKLRAYRLHLPVMAGIITMEAIEAILWSRPDELLPIDEASASLATSPCPTRNAVLTAFVWMAILPWQPYLILTAERRWPMNDQHARDLLRGPELLAVALALTFDAFAAYSSIAPGPFRTLEDSGLRGYMSSQTCTYVGLHHHLHWSIRLVDTFLTPNVFSYVLLWSATLFFRPILHNAAFFAIMIFLGQSFYYGTFEAGSVWCWLCILVFLGGALQVHRIPLHDKPIEMHTCVGRHVCEEELTECRRRRHHQANGTAGITYDRPRGTRGMDRCEGMIAAPGWPFSSDAKCKRHAMIKVPSEKNLLALGERTRWMYRSMTNIAESFDQSRHRGIVSPSVAGRRCPTKRSRSHLGLADSAVTGGRFRHHHKNF